VTMASARPTLTCAFPSAPPPEEVPIADGAGMARSPLIWVPLAEIFYLAAVWWEASRSRSRSDRRIAQPIADQITTGLIYEIRGASPHLRRPGLSHEWEGEVVRARPGRR
jgi:hypothetical protein